MGDLNLKECFLGIEFGSTRIKAVLINSEHEPIAQGNYDWENKLEDGIWTYHMDDIWQGLQGCYASLCKGVKDKFNQEITTLKGIGFSAMMHGYLAFDKEGNLLVPFRTWRNTNARVASQKLTEYFQFNIPERWSISHLYQSILDNLDHVKNLDFFTTLSGYIHWQLSGQKVLGVGDAAGMFPIDSTINDFDQNLVNKFDALVKDKNYGWKLSDLLPKVLVAGDDAGVLTEKGAKLLDPTGKLQSGIPLCPPEGDAGTGMVATNSVAKRTGNVSAGTSIFAMIVLEKALAKLHREIDMVTTPDGSPVAMVHANNCTSDLNAWVNIFAQYNKAAGIDMDMNTLFSTLYNHALTGDADCGGVLCYNYFSGEFITGLEEGRPLVIRKPDANFTLANFMRSNLYTTLGAVRLGMDILIDEEKVALDSLLGHGGLFKTKGVGQQIMADAINVPVSVMSTAGEGGAWGIAILAAYEVNKEANETLPEFLKNKVFAKSQCDVVSPKAEGVAGFNKFMKDYVACLGVEKAATEYYK